MKPPSGRRVEDVLVVAIDHDFDVAEVVLVEEDAVAAVAAAGELEESVADGTEDAPVYYFRTTLYIVL